MYKVKKTLLPSLFLNFVAKHFSLLLFLWNCEGLWIRWNFREILWKSCNRKDWKLFQTQLCTFHWKRRYQWVCSGEKICLGRREIDIYWAAHQGSDDAPIYGLSTALATKWPKDKIEGSYSYRSFGGKEDINGEKIFQGRSLGGDRLIFIGQPLLDAAAPISALATCSLAIKWPKAKGYI